MQVTEHVHAIKIPFPGTSRFVYVYLIYGENICLIDSGILAGRERLFSYLRETGRDTKEISLLVQTHSHPDHIGLSGEIKRISNCKVAIHEAEKTWVEDIDLQERMRPTLTFRAFVQQPVAVDVTLQDGQTLDWGEGLSLQVIHIPGHSNGHIAIFFPQDGALFTGDGVPPYGGVPIYEDICESIRSIGKLKALQGIQAIFSSWHEPQKGERAYALMDESLSYLQKVHGLVRRIHGESPSLNPRELAVLVLMELGLPTSPLSPNVITTMKAHLKEIEHPDILTLALQ